MPAKLRLLEQARRSREQAERTRRLARGTCAADVAVQLEIFAQDLEARAAEQEQQAEALTKLSCRSAALALDIAEIIVELHEKTDKTAMILLKRSWLRRERRSHAKPH